MSAANSNLEYATSVATLMGHLSVRFGQRCLASLTPNSHVMPIHEKACGLDTECTSLEELGTQIERHVFMSVLFRFQTWNQRVRPLHSGLSREVSALWTF